MQDSVTFKDAIFRIVPKVAREEFFNVGVILVLSHHGFSQTSETGMASYYNDKFNQKTVIVTINDRGPFVKGRVLDLSKAAAIKLDYIDEGVTKVKWVLLSNK